MQPPENTGTLLGLGAKYCIEQSRPQLDMTQSIYRFTRSIRLRYWLLAKGDSGNEPPEANSDPSYIPSLYVQSKWNPPTVDGGTIENRMLDFATHIEQASKTLTKQPPQFNLTREQHQLMKLLQSDDRFIVCQTDKNLGPAVIERDAYIRLTLKDHLSDETTYQLLSTEERDTILSTTRQRYVQMLAHHSKSLRKAEKTYFERSMKLHDYRTPLFYITMKVHKTPLKSRPVTSTVNSLSNVFSKWLDYRMKELIPLSKSHLRDSYQVLKELKAIGKLPASAKLFTSDAVSMYTNIDPDHGLSAFNQWFDEYPDEIPSHFPKALFLQVLETVMTTNVFEFGDTNWLQLKGTAMGTSCACLYATLYYALHERRQLLAKYSTSLIYYRRFIDDILGIWNGTEAEWANFQIEMNQFGRLRWTTSDLSTEAIFLDLRIKIGPLQHIETVTYQKPMNLFLYIPPSSAHPPGVLKSTIYGNLRRFWLQNSKLTDYIKVTQRFASHLIARGHNSSNISKLFLEAAEKIDKGQCNGNHPQANAKATTASSLFFHVQFHPRGLTRTKIRRVYAKFCEGHTNFNRLTIAYSRPPNLRDALIKSRLRATPDYVVSNYL
jgi:hypothetical protein